MPVTGQFLINLESLERSELQTDPYPFVIVPDFLNTTSSAEILKDFPAIPFGGSVPLPGLEYGPSFARLIQELEGQDLRACLERKFSIDLSNRPTFITVRGRTRAKDGRIHSDTKSKLLTLLLYFNPEWTVEAGRLRILRSGNNLDDYVAEIPPEYGTCLIFRVTENCWHGHKPYQGERRAIQLNYLRDETDLRQHLSKHQLSARVKSWKRWFSRGEEY